MIVWNWNKVNSYIWALKPLPRKGAHSWPRGPLGYRSGGPCQHSKQTFWSQNEKIKSRLNTGDQHIYYICRRRRGHCPWSRNFHVEQFCLTWKQSCSTWQNSMYVMWISFVMWTYYKLFPVPYMLHVTNLQFMLSWRDLRCFDANPCCRDLRTFVWNKIYPKILSVEQKWQIWCLDQQWPACFYPSHI